MTQVIDTIAAIATPAGRGGVGIIRVSGPLSAQIAQRVCGRLPSPRYAHYGPFCHPDGRVLDYGLALYFVTPNSFTGEDVLELQGHGGPVVLDQVLKTVYALGARPATPGEFSERAFLNGKLDLVQAEAIADLIDASSEQAARSALHSLQGAFSEKITSLVERVIALRVYVEAAIDFPEEEIDFLADGHVKRQLDALSFDLDQIHATAQRGRVLREGVTVVLTGAPNAGKSSLLNALSGEASAIVTDVPGTTRDILREYIHIDGIPIHLLDTAGLRASEDPVEKKGIERAVSAMQTADRLLLIVDATEKTPGTPLKALWPKDADACPEGLSVTVVFNKVDLIGEASKRCDESDYTALLLSAKTGDGIDLLRTHLTEALAQTQLGEGQFMARRRHLQAISDAQSALNESREQFFVHHAGELLAEDLRAVQHHLSKITGEWTSDDLLGEIFSQFCIGK